MTERLTGRAIYQAMESAHKEISELDDALLELEDMRGTKAWNLVANAKEAAEQHLRKLQGTYYQVEAQPRSARGKDLD